MPPAAGGKETSSGKLALAGAVALALLAGIALFFVAPLILTTSLFNVEQDPFLFNLAAGGVRVTIFLLYLGLMTTIPDIRRLFEYHGAEHKAVFAFERGEPLTVEAAGRQSRFHPRCGTSFLLLVMIVAIISFALLDTVVMLWTGGLTILVRLATHLPLIPVIGGLSYEVIRFSAKKSNTALGSVLAAPGLWLQRITTREPDAGQLEVALAALRGALGEDEEAEIPGPTKAQEASVG